MNMEKIKNWACQVAQECIAYGWWSWEMANDWVRDYGQDVEEIAFWDEATTAHRCLFEMGAV